jgi:hypothetical protein
VVYEALQNGIVVVISGPDEPVGAFLVRYRENSYVLMMADSRSHINPHAGAGTTNDENLDQVATGRVVKTWYRNILI